jgi:hypothetical protein
MNSDRELGMKRWFRRPDTLTAAAGGTLASALLLLLMPNIGTLFLEILAAMVILAWAYRIRRRERAAAQLRLDLGATPSRLRLPDRYELLLMIIVILGYGTIVSALRTLRTPEVLVRAAPLLLFAAGLLVKDHILRGIAALITARRERALRSRKSWLRDIEVRQTPGQIQKDEMAVQSVPCLRVESERRS